MPRSRWDDRPERGISPHHRRLCQGLGSNLEKFGKILGDCFRNGRASRCSYQCLETLIQSSLCLPRSGVNPRERPWSLNLRLFLFFIWLCGERLRKGVSGEPWVQGTTSIVATGFPVMYRRLTAVIQNLPPLYRGIN